MKEKQKSIKYPFALDEDNNLIIIDDAIVDRDNTRSYHCPECGEPLSPRAGSRSPHFYHSGNQKCGLESYVHRIAKEILVHKFNDRSKPFIIEFKPIIKCRETGTCTNEKDNCFCWPKKTVTYDLHKHYNLPAEEEMRVIEEDGRLIYVADVLLRSSDPLWKDVLIEVYHTHKTTAEKIESGHRIIEIQIRDVEELKALQSTDCIKEGNNTVFYNFTHLIAPEMVLENRKEYSRECGAELPLGAFPPCLSNQQSVEALCRCPYCGGKLVLRRGKYNQFYGCSNYPNCHFILN